MIFSPFFLFFFVLSQVSSQNYTLLDHVLSQVERKEAGSLVDRCGKKFGTTQILMLLDYITKHYLENCVNVILYEKRFETDEASLNFNLRKFLKEFPQGYINGQISKSLKINKEVIEPKENRCKNFILLLRDVTTAVHIVGKQITSKVIIVTLSTRWKIEEYLEGFSARTIVNLLIISNSNSQENLIRLEEQSNKKQDINLYTHDLYVDGVGSSAVRFLTAWRCGNLTRNIDLFPPKMLRGFSGRQFAVSASQEPPFTFKRRDVLEDDVNESHLWDGLEIRLLRLLSDYLNYTVEIKEPKDEISIMKGPSDLVVNDVASGNAEIGLGGIYITNDRITQVSMSHGHTVDCAAFITKASTALPRYRAILGPFRWTVWLALTFTYLIAIIPLTFADSHSLRPLIKNPWHLETMFWYVFGTFTNLFTFTGEKSWTRTKKFASRQLIGWYWIFTIIVTACYTGSIISFITLFVYPDVVDNVDQLVDQNFRIGSLSTGGWGKWFNESDHEKTKWLLRDIELIPNTTQGLKNVSNSFYIPMFRPYAFLAGRMQMEYIVMTNYTTKRKKDMLHISKDCFVPFGVAFTFPLHAVYSERFNAYLLRVVQSGLMAKMMNEFRSEIEKISSGKLLQISGNALKGAMSAERKLTLDDMQGMYLLMGAGYLMAVVILIFEATQITIKERKTVTFKQRIEKTFFWRSRYFQAFTNVVRLVIEQIRQKRQKYDKDSEFPTFKKYDSRIVNSYPMRKVSWPVREPPVPVYFSEFQLNQLDRTPVVPGSKSMPNIASELKMQVTPARCSSLEEKSYEYDCVVKDRKESLKFGSVNSLPWDVGDVVHSHENFVDDRAQST